MIEKLKEQLKKFEEEFEIAKAALYRLDGAIQATRYLISETEKPEVAKESKSKAK